MPEDVGPIIDELKAGKKPTPGPRFVSSLLNFECWIIIIIIIVTATTMFMAQ